MVRLPPVITSRLNIHESRYDEPAGVAGVECRFNSAPKDAAPANFSVTGLGQLPRQLYSSSQSFLILPFN